jgi:LPS sulfotransferase NodH
MILASARTGSNLLSSLLSRHSSIKVYGELFNLDALPRPSLLEALEDPVRYLRNRVYKARPGEIAAVGFKMFYDHLTRDYFQKLVNPSEASEQLQDKFRQFASFIDANYDWPTLDARFRDAWDFLVADQSLMVIHLKRRNILNTLVSLKTAFVTTQWWTSTSGGQATTTLHLDPEECRSYFEKLDTSAEQADALFGKHPKLEVLYEDLVEAREETLERILSFLNVELQPLSTGMQKQIVAPASEIVANYGQLKDCFQHTKWHAFFE